jgi:SpoVK/Ycf46/Vps4 family AAA+-type ATPase
VILNQFIYPLEERESIVKFSGGSAMRVPFEQRLFLSTNLNHEEIIDDAFRRRLLYQILVDRPTIAEWKEIFGREALLHGIREELALEAATAFMQWYQEDGRVIRKSDPRDLLVKMLATLDKGQSINDVFDLALVRRIYEKYPASYMRDAKAYVGAVESTGPAKS